jgi:hypothetical protein
MSDIQVIQVTQPNANGPLQESLATVSTTGGGGGGGSSFAFFQSSPLATWVILHNLNQFPLQVSVMDSTNTEVMVQTHFDSANQVSLLFSAPESGTAYLST